MKTIGLIGGMSWESSKVYYELINQKVKESLGGYHSAKCILYSVDFAEIEVLQNKGDWDRLNQIMAEIATQLQKAGAEIIVLCTNTMHLCSTAIQETISIPFLHIAEATGMEIKEKGLKKVGLLGTRFTMEMDFYKKILRDKFGIETITPSASERENVHNIIYQELVDGKIRDESKGLYKSVIHGLEDDGAEGIILGCTEIPLLINQDDVDVPIFDTTRIHAEKAVEMALK